ncbi:MAG: hypothetical protein LBH00_06490 [Planctomycetaceae bacterium]|nr:hypothetical protein [Planctomycetaceae bacterium]
MKSSPDIPAALISGRFRPIISVTTINLIKTMIQKINSVLRRSRIQCVFNSVSTGIFFAMVIFLLFGSGMYLAGAETIPLQTYFGYALAAGIFGGCAAVFTAPLNADSTARKIDEHYQLKDRILTAYQFRAKESKTTLEQIQLADAEVYAEKIMPQSVSPYKLPGDFFPAVIVTFLSAAACAALPETAGQNQYTPSSNETVVQLTEQLREDVLAPLAGLAAAAPDDEELQKLNTGMQQFMRSLEQTAADPEESLAAMTKMEQTLRQTIEAFHSAAADASLRDIAGALENAAASRQTAAAIKEGNLEKAAEEWERMDFAGMTRRERETVSKELSHAAEKTEQRRQTQLAQLTRKLAESMKKADAEECRKTACQFAGECRKQCARKGVCDKLNCALAKLGLCKSECASACGSCPKKDSCGSAQSSLCASGQGQGQKPGQLVGGTPDQGEETSLNSIRNKKMVSGMDGEGTADTETVLTAGLPGEKQKETAHSGKQRSGYRKETEDVLRSELIPPEQRRVIRQYFESIHSAEER